MASDSNFADAFLPHTTRKDRFRCSVRVFHAAEFIGHLVIEGLVHPGEERHGCGSRQGALAVQPIDFALVDDMRAGFERKGACLGFEFRSGEGPFDVARPRVMPLDQV